MVLVDDPHIYERRRSDTSEDDACKGGQRLKQLLSIEENMRKLLDQGDLVQEER